MFRGMICATVMAMVGAFASPAMAGGKCGEKSECGSPCGERISGSPCGEPCKVAKNPCEPKCKTKAGKCGECVTTCKMPKVDADIEKLKVVNPKCSSELCVEWQVDIENMCGPYDLIIQVKDDCDAIVYERVIALDSPFRTGDDGTENHYRGSYADQLAGGVAYNSKLKAEGNVVARGTRASVDRERERVRTSDSDHGYATVFYQAGDVLVRPVSLVTRPIAPTAQY